MWVGMPSWPTASAAFNALSSSIPLRPHRLLHRLNLRRNDPLNNSKVDRHLVNRSEALVYCPTC
jgi:hypothetical protein